MKELEKQIDSSCCDVTYKYVLWLDIMYEMSKVQTLSQAKCNFQYYARVHLVVKFLLIVKWKSFKGVGGCISHQP